MRRVDKTEIFFARYFQVSQKLWKEPLSLSFRWKFLSRIRRCCNRVEWMMAWQASKTRRRFLPVCSIVQISRKNYLQFRKTSHTRLWRKFIVRWNDLSERGHRNSHFEIILYATRMRILIYSTDWNFAFRF